MISRQELERLAALRADEGILSAYISVDPRRRGEQFVAKFKSAASRFSRRTKDAGLLSVLEREKSRVLRHLEESPPTDPSVVIFSSEPAGIWEVLILEVPLATHLAVDATTHTALLTQMLDEYPRMAVALLDGDTARIYFAEQGIGRQFSEIESTVPGQHDQGGWSQARFQRHIEFHGARHVKEVVEELERLHRTEPFDRLVLVGVEEQAREAAGALSQPMSERFIGDLTANFKQEDDGSILERARQLRQEDERRREVSLVEQLVGGADSGGLGIVGIDESIQAVSSGRVRVLAVAQGITAEGSICQNCDYYAATKFDACPMCGGVADVLPDAIEHTIEQALLTGSAVNVVFGEARSSLLSRGGLGAILRY